MNRIYLRNTLTMAVAILLICSVAAAQTTGSHQLSVEQRPLALPTTSETATPRGAVGSNGTTQNSQQIPVSQRTLAQPTTQSTSQPANQSASKSTSPLTTQPTSQPASQSTNRPAVGLQRGETAQAASPNALRGSVPSTSSSASGTGGVSQGLKSANAGQGADAQGITGQSANAGQYTNAGQSTNAGQGPSVKPASTEKTLEPPTDSTGTATKGTSGNRTSETAGKTATDKKPEVAKKAIPGLRQLLVATGMLALLFVGLILLLKKLRPKEAGQLPKDVFEVLGKSPLAFRQQVYFLRGGDRIFLIALSANGVDKIGEITDPVEVVRITQRCHGEAFVPVTLPVNGANGNASGSNGGNSGNATGQGGFAGGQAGYGTTSQTVNPQAVSPQMVSPQTGAGPQGSVNGSSSSGTTSLEELYRQTMRR